MPIDSLSISYPDFKLGEMIDPDAFDLNNQQIITKSNEIITVVNGITGGSFEITLDGDVQGSGVVNGLGNATITTTIDGFTFDAGSF